MRHFIGLTLCAAALYATPQLRLSTSTIGPLNIAVGQNGPAQTVQTSNIGDGTLSLSATSNVPWITASMAGANVQIALATAALAKGIVTGIVTVSSPNAIDSPQTIAVTVQMGGGVPDSLNLYLAPGGSVTSTFIASNTLNANASSPGGGLTLSVIATGGTSFTSIATYQVTANAPVAVTPETSFTANIKVTSSGFTPDVKTVPVTLTVTALPIAVLLPSSLQFNVGQGAAAVAKWIQMPNVGQGTLAVTAATVSTGAAWLTTSLVGTTVVATGDPTGLAPGTYTATISIASNAKNGPFTVPVEMDVIATAPPYSYYRGVVDNALFQIGGTVAPGGLVAIKGEQFTTGPAVSAATLPLGTSLGNATVYVNGVAAPIYYAAASHVVNMGGQITFQMPYNTPAGQATVRVDRTDNGTVLTGNTISVPVQGTVPRLLQFPFLGQEYAIATFTDFTTFPVPTTPGVPSRPAIAGDTLVFYALGLGQTTPHATEGIAVTGTPGISNCVMVFAESTVLGPSLTAAPTYCGLTPGLVGLYQVNVVVPPGTPKGNATPVYLAIGNAVSNTVVIAVK